MTRDDAYSAQTVAWVAMQKIKHLYRMQHIPPQQEGDKHVFWADVQPEQHVELEELVLLDKLLVSASLSVVSNSAGTLRVVIRVPASSITDAS